MKKCIILTLTALLFIFPLFSGAGGPEPTVSSSLSTNETPFPPADPLLPNPVRIVHPFENARIQASTTYVCGSAPSNGKLSINGKPVPVHAGGGFLAMVDLRPGQFQIKAELQWQGATYRLIRTVKVVGPEQAAPVSPLTIEYVTPRSDLELLPGDCVEVVCKGSPGMQGFFTVKGVKGKFPLTETSMAPGGIYHGVYRIGSRDRLNKARIKVTLVDQRNRKVSKEADGILSLFAADVPALVEVISPDAVLFAGPAPSSVEKAGYVMFPPPGTILQVNGKKGEEYRVRLTETRTVWVSASQVRPLPAGTLPPRVVVGSISVNAGANATMVRIPLGRKIPFHIDPAPEEGFIDISLFGAFSNTDWIANASCGVIKQVRWFQDDEETYRLRIYTGANGWWGYDARYEGNGLVLELRTPPPYTANNSPLAGLTVAVDAGHGAGNGAIGPTGYAEGDANLAMAFILKEKLQAKGARVIMTRPGSEDVSLRERPKTAWRHKADMLISLHNNALPYGGNPFIRRGFGVYYFTPMSLPLAKEIHAAYQEKFRAGGEYVLRDDGLYYGNLALARSPQMPSVLVESAYIIVPEEEAYLKTEAFRAACAEAIIGGIERYARRMRLLVKR